MNRAEQAHFYYALHLNAERPIGDYNQELPVDCLIKAALGGDIEVAQDSAAVDNDVKNALSGRGELDVGKPQREAVRAVCDRNGIGEIAIVADAGRAIEQWVGRVTYAVAGV